MVMKVQKGQKLSVRREFAPLLSAHHLIVNWNQLNGAKSDQPLNFKLTFDWQSKSSCELYTLCTA